MPTVATDPAAARGRGDLFGARRRRRQPVARFSTGFVAQRIVAMVISVGTEIAQQRIATAQDIDLAVRTGLGYPVGPLSMGDELGPARVLAVLEGIHRTTGDPRYRPGRWLRRRAPLGPVAADRGLKAELRVSGPVAACLDADLLAERTPGYPMATDENQGSGPMAERHRFDVRALESYLSGRIDGFAGPLRSSSSAAASRTRPSSCRPRRAAT